MNVSLIQKSGNFLSFLIKGINFSFANTLRRIIITEVPSMTIDEAVIIENSSVLNDEILALRLGLIPLTTDLDSYNMPEECTCGSELGCNLCRTVLTLDVRAEDKTRIVFSGEFIPEDNKITPVAKNIAIVKLAQGQKIRLEAYAKLGKGKTHAKWQPVSACTYRFMPEIKIDASICNGCNKCVDVCPKKVFMKKENQPEIKSLIDCILCLDCVNVCPQDKKAIKVSWDETSFIFKIESTGCLPVERIVFKALKICEKKFTELKNEIKGIKDESKNI
jgi:DNA-directed RNA polymerase subunit D